jgi:P-type Ca2+ transporter type 2C
VWILLAALFISFSHGEKVDAAVILVILIINAVLGFIQEYNAENEIEALKKIAGQKALVIRDGKQREIDASEVVPGDVLIVKEGDKVPADARIIEGMQLAAQESILTGESLPVKKTADKTFPDVAVSEQRNMLFPGTIITRGKGKMVVVRTGIDSEIGRIAKLFQDTEKEKTPLQGKLAKMGGMLSIITVVVCALVFFTGLFSGANPLEIFTIAVALAGGRYP